MDNSEKLIIVNALHTKNVNVSFTKKDGSARDMLCTLLESNIPSDKRPKSEGTKVSDDAVRVFDVEKQEWRSFRWDSIKSVKGL